MYKIQRGFAFLLLCCMLLPLLPSATAEPASNTTVVETGTVGTGGAPWRLYSDGTLVVESGTIDMTNMGEYSRPWPRGTRKIIFTGSITAGTSLSELFSSMNVESIIGLEYFDNDNVTDMSYMFRGTRNIVSLNMSGFDTRNVTDMSGMFSFSDITNLDLSGFDTRNVTNMRSMFVFSSITNLDLSGWDTGNVANMAAMFGFARNLVSVDVSGFNTSSATNMNSMFFNATSLVNLDLSNFDTSNVTDMDLMFSDATSLISLDISSFNTSNVTSMFQMFAHTPNLINLDLSSFDTGNVTNMSRMFSSASNLTSLDLSGFDTRNVTHMGSMFGGPLRQVTLGEHFHFVAGRFRWFSPYDLPGEDSYCIGPAHLPSGKWQNVGDGTVVDPRGDFIFTERLLATNFDGATMADTWVRISGYDFPFTDVAEHRAARHAIWYLYENNIMKGTSATTFSPEATLTRAMTATILHRLAGLPEVAFDKAFDDVSAGQWYSDAIVWAAQNDIVRGIGGGRFAPQGNVTREQFTTMLHRFASFYGYDIAVPVDLTLNFPDVDFVGDWALEGMAWAVYNRLITGPGPKMLRPLDYATRVEVAVILERFMLDLN